MTTGVVCPHCETRFQLSRDLIGKSMRCPNRECGEVFEVVDADAPVAPPAAPKLPIAQAIEAILAAPTLQSPALPEANLAATLISPSLVTPPESPVHEFDFSPVPKPVAGSVSDFVPVLEGEAVTDPDSTVSMRAVRDADLVQPGPAPTLARVLAAPPKARVLAAPTVPVPGASAPLPVAKSLPAPKEVDWSSAPAEITAPGTASRASDSNFDDDDAPIRTRAKKQGGLSKVIFGMLVVVLLATVGATVYMLFLREVASENQLANEAKLLFDDGKYGDAAKRYDQLLVEFPSSEKADEYRFFSKFATLQTSIGAVATRDNPATAQKVFTQFVGEFGETPLAKPQSGFGALIEQAGQKLVSIFNDHAADRVKEFRKDRTKPPTPLEVADKSLAEGLTLLASLEKFRDPATPAPEALRAKFDTVAADIAAERGRLATLLPWRNLSEAPTEERIEEFEVTMIAANLNKDAEVVEMAAAARKAIRELIRFNADPLVAKPLRGEPKSVAFVAPAVLGSPAPKAAIDENRETVHAVSRGVLYALDGHTGELRWAVRIAGQADPKPPEALVVPLGDGAGEWVIVPTNLEGKPTLMARRGRTGEPEWVQSLAAPAFGRPVRIGGQLFVALQDEVGTVVQFDLRTGEQAGSFEIRQRLGTPLAVLPGTRQGHGFLIIPGDSRRVFVVEVGRETEDGARIPPTCVRILLTDHPRDSLLGEPVLAVTADVNAARRLILAQRAGTKGTKLRAFGLPNPTELAEVKSEPETPVELTGDVTVSGYIGFSPISDGERVAVATDTGVFAVFGVAQPGNNDKPLFAVPGAKPSGNAELLDNAQVISADDDTYWVLINGEIVRLRKAVDLATGPRLIPTGSVNMNEKTVSLGAAAGRPQLRPSLNIAVVTVRPEQADAVHMVAFDLETGEVRWWRQLGAIAAHAPIPTSDGSHLLVDQAGGVYKLTRTVPVPGGESVLSATTLANPRAAIAGLPASVCVSADGKDVWVSVADSAKGGINLLLRKFTDGKPAGETTVPIAGKPVGPSVLLGDKLLVPLLSGSVYRIGITDTEAQQGPLWKATGGGNDVRCYLTVTGPDEFLVTDGGTRAVRWKWGTDAPQKSGGPWTARNPIHRPATVVKVADKPHYLIGDSRGIVLLFDPARTTDSIRRWNSTPEGPIPPGAATGPEVTAGNLVISTVDRKAIVALDATKDAAVWVVPEIPEAGEVIGLTSTGKRLLVTYLSGLVRQIDPETGTVLTEARRDFTAGTARVGAALLGETELLMPSASGAIGTLQLLPVGR